MWTSNSNLIHFYFCRFSYIALCTLSLLHRLHKIDMQKAVGFVVSCKNLDGGFGAMPGGESHAGQSMSYFHFYWKPCFVFFKYTCNLS
jgi:hypothetical protein